MSDMLLDVVEYYRGFNPPVRGISPRIWMTFSDGQYVPVNPEARFHIIPKLSTVATPTDQWQYALRCLARGVIGNTVYCDHRRVYSSLVWARRKAALMRYYALEEVLQSKINAYADPHPWPEPKTCVQALVENLDAGRSLVEAYKYSFDYDEDLPFDPVEHPTLTALLAGGFAPAIVDYMLESGLIPDQ